MASLSGWSCEGCSLINVWSKDQCFACYEDRPKNLKNPGISSKSENANSNSKAKDSDSKQSETANISISYHDIFNDKSKCICGSFLVLTKLPSKKRGNGDDSKHSQSQCNECDYLFDNKTDSAFNCRNTKANLTIHKSGYYLCNSCVGQRRSRFASNLVTKMAKMQSSNKKCENVMISPLSITTALSMALCGAKDSTLTQMLSVLYPAIYDAKFLKLNKLGFSDAKDVCKCAIEMNEYYNSKYSNMICISNRLWINKKFNLSDAYMEAVGRVNVSEIDVENAKKACSLINEWVSASTKGLIDKLVKESDLNALRMLITNAIYFRGEFEIPFDAAMTAQNSNFYADSSKQNVLCKVAMMSDGSGGQMRTFAKNVKFGGSVFDAVKLHYKSGSGGDIALVLAKNNKKNGIRIGISELLSAKFERGSLKLFVPKFEFSKEYLLNETLISMGMNNAFFEPMADFGNMTAEKVWIDWVKHKAIIKVDETGTVASAVTAVKMTNKSIVVNTSPQMRFEYIFDFYIIDQDNRNVLFSGTFAGK